MTKKLPNYKKAIDSIVYKYIFGDLIILTVFLNL